MNLRRILNVPKRGLGDRAEGVLLAYAREHGTSFFYALMHLDEIEVPTRTATSLRAFRDLMGALSQFTRAHDSKPSEIVAEVLEKSGLRAELEKSVDPQDASRLENLSQLQSTAAEFEQNTPDATLSAFLETTALVADSDQLPGEAEDSGRAMRRFREDGSRRAVIVPFCTTAVPQMPRRCPPGSVTKPQRVISCME